jgi:transcription-repair coupling factor (superfamily II helicase)
MSNFFNKFCDSFLAKPKEHFFWLNLIGASQSLAISSIAERSNNFIVVIAPSIAEAIQLEQELKFLTKTTSLPVLFFPDWETLPYDHFSPHKDLISERIYVLHRLSKLKRGILITSIVTLSKYLAPPAYLTKDALLLKIGEQIDTPTFRQALIKQCYYSVNQVIEPGEFAFRGSIIDLFPTGAKLPFRIDLLDQTIESIRTFDPETQRSLEKIAEINLLPAKEFPLTDEAIKVFSSNWKKNFGVSSIDSPIYQNIINRESAPGIEFYLPLFFEEQEIATGFDYFPENSLIITINDLYTKANNLWQEIKNRYEELRYDQLRPILPPAQIFLTTDQIFAKIKNFSHLTISQEKEPTGKHNTDLFPIEKLPPLEINHRHNNPFNALENFLTTSQKPVLFVAPSQGRKETLLEILRKINISPKVFSSWNEFQENFEKNRFALVVASFDQGFIIPNYLSVITENELFGEQKTLQRKSGISKVIDTDAIIKNLTELKIGDPIVHIEYGVGRYLGLTAFTEPKNTEFLIIVFADDAKLYVPISSLHLVSRYSGSSPENAPLSHLGSKHWEKIKAKTIAKIRDVAAELLEIYAKRKAKKGFAFNIPQEEYQKFSALFPFSETPDQEKAINEVINDMAKPIAMDRLICGDVGFGKTEVAMRAAFISVYNKKQVAILTPTTILAKQHYENFQDRFAGWPINIEMLSRFKNSKEQKEIISKITEGKIDIIIGTHKLLQGTINFKDLGLLVIDEEHRFGVQHKEKIKSLRPDVDILTLTATPIPRTLNMALSGIRDFSIIATPPLRRLAIKTFLCEKNTHTIEEAIAREILRGGQVYFLNNNVARIETTKQKISKLFPNARIATAHGQMRERQLEKIMSDFYHLKYNVLVCTTIIESGIDVPTANTIIIDEADHFGLAELHQLRGRVGRSHHQAYAYLLINSRKTLTKDALKRLEAITMLEDLGAGFYLANHDLEIRGAGALLGEEQSGQIEEIGFSLYLEYLDDAVKALKLGKEPDPEAFKNKVCEIDLQIPALIPENYVNDVSQRLILYKRIANCKDQNELQNLKEEFIDRFGELSLATNNLFKIASLKLDASNLGIKKISFVLAKNYLLLDFHPQTKIDSNKIVSLLQKEPTRYQLKGSRQLAIVMAKTDSNRIEIISNFLQNSVSDSKG